VNQSLSARLDAIARAKTINGINYALNKNSRWERVKTGVAHGAVHLGENMAAWKVGKVVGGAIGQVAASHGADPEVARLLSETAVQALTSTALYARGGKRSGTDIATHMIAQSAAAFSGKVSHTGVDDLSEALGGSERVTAISALVAGKMAGITTVVAAHKSGVARSLAEGLPAAKTRIGSLVGSDAILERSGQRRATNARSDGNPRKPLNLAEVDNAAELVMMGYAIAAYEIVALDKYRGDSMSLALDLLRIDLARMDDWKRIGPNQRGAKCNESRGWYGVRGGCVRGKKGATGDDLKAKRKESAEKLADKIRSKKGMKSKGEVSESRAPKAREIAQVKKDLAGAQADLDLAGRVYANTNAKLSGEEYKRTRQLGLDAGVSYKRLEKLRKQEFEYRERLKELTGGKDEGPKTQKVTKGPMSEGEANAPLSAEDRKKLTSTFEPPEATNAGRLDLAASRKTAMSVLADVKKSAGYEKVRVEDVQAIRSYTGNGYVGINGAMRGLQSDPGSDLSQRQRLAARATQQAIQKLPKYEGELRRDTRLSAEEIKRDFKVGGTVSFKGLTSASADTSGDAAGSYGSQESLSKASFYGDKAARNGIQSSPTGASEQVEFRIKAKSGRDISPFSTRKHEREILLPHGWRGTVSRVESAKGKTVIHMEES
jgi:hypothetical protein